MAVSKNIRDCAAQAAEPPINRDPANLDPNFRAKLLKTLEILASEGIPFKFHEGFRSVERQRWLYGQGRPTARTYGRSGSRVTNADGVKKISNHQGNGEPGSGRAADCYPADATGKVLWPPPPDKDQRWIRYAEVAEAQGLTAGYRWKSRHDPPHIELRRTEES